MNHELTIKEYAAVERVNERTVRRWIEKGAIEVRRTPSGRVRILAERGARIAIMRAFADTHGHPST